MTHPRLWIRPEGRLATLLLCLSLSLPAQAIEYAPLTITASNYPLAYFAERLGGAQVRVELPVPNDEDPAYWQPDAPTIQAMQKADLIALNGADYEKWLNRVSLPHSKWVDTSAAFKSRYLVIKDAVTHSHGGNGMHSHDGTASTTWLDFTQAAQQVDALAAAMIRTRPALRSTIEHNRAALDADLMRLDADMKQVAGALAGQALMASHPVYQYLERRYGLNLKSVHWEPGEMPPASEWTALRQTLSAHPARLMLWEEMPSTEIQATLAELKLRPLDFRPCANRPVSGDWLSIMRANIAHLQEASTSSPEPIRKKSVRAKSTPPKTPARKHGP
ncbi:MAG: metal ABC transporter substrate-binding protein [Methylococcaceae bacterium]|nr:metal ABC transporter substrate-binding protein [Methylococcaceae bacterium]